MYIPIPRIRAKWVHANAIMLHLLEQSCQVKLAANSLLRLPPHEAFHHNENETIPHHWVSDNMLSCKDRATRALWLRGHP